MIASQPQLLVVLPIFNEEESISSVIQEWFATLVSHAPDFRLLAIDDGSTDRTLDLLHSLKSGLGDRLEILTRPNRGHGQTCIEGYKIALDRKIPFILQIDSDGQSEPSHFQEFWALREDFDVIYGKRNRSDGARRVLASAVLRTLLRLIAKADCVDANVPYRLMRSESCAKAIRSVSPDIFLANVALAVGLAKSPEIHHGSIPINFPPRKGGEPSVPFLKFASKGLELFIQLRKSGIPR
ncbi:glycosyltransferase family 2 protein [Akkermansiaceae bacterium]|nr:glycosyltransferase family 2 protein [Akkermansiaceae bacterium]